MNIEEFVKYVKDHKDQFHNYCEIIITRSGLIELARPSHQKALIRLAAEKYNQTSKEYMSSIPIECSPEHWIIDKEHMIAVWYNCLLIPSKPNRVQLKVLDRLKNEGIINPEHITYSDEYKNYLYREKLFNGEKGEE